LRTRNELAVRAHPDHHKGQPVAQKPYTLASLSRRLSELLGVSEQQ